MASGPGAQRSKNEIILYLSPKQPLPVVPFELQNHISQETWDERIPALTRAASRYSKPLFERLWLVLALILMVVAPLVCVPIIANHLKHSQGDDHRLRDFAEVRAIGFGIFVGVILLFFAPLAVWKYLGHREVNSMINKWARFDTMTKRTGGFVPSWRVKTPGIFRDSIVLTITMPTDTLPTNFHPAAYLPTYINANIAPPDQTHTYQYLRSMIPNEKSVQEA